MFDNIATWRVFWSAVTFFQGFIAVCCDLGEGYSNTTISQWVLIFYSVLISGLGTYQYLTNYFHFIKSDNFDTHLMGNLVIASLLLGLFDVGWYVGLGSGIVVFGGLIYRVVYPDDPYHEFSPDDLTRHSLDRNSFSPSMA
tara:strand:+ start:512 stop:934 length:423 start_codon:yes stop_codon:yes gene_type:complete